MQFSNEKKKKKKQKEVNWLFFSYSTCKMVLNV